MQKEVLLAAILQLFYGGEVFWRRLYKPKEGSSWSTELTKSTMSAKSNSPMAPIPPLINKATDFCIAPPLYRKTEFLCPFLFLLIILPAILILLRRRRRQKTKTLENNESETTYIVASPSAIITCPSYPLLEEGPLRKRASAKKRASSRKVRRYKRS